MTIHAPLTKHRTVCSVQLPGGTSVLALVQVDDDTGYIRVRGFIDREDWEDFGSPEEITVTFEPGNLLNDEGSTT
jgi:hypothetical protein